MNEEEEEREGEGEREMKRIMTCSFHEKKKDFGLQNP